MIPSRRGLARIFLFTARDNLQRIIRKRSLQFESLGQVSQQPQINLRGRCQNDRHCFRMDWCDDGVRFRREKAEQLMLPINWRALRPSNAAPRGP